MELVGVQRIEEAKQQELQAAERQGRMIQTAGKTPGMGWLNSDM